MSIEILGSKFGMNIISDETDKYGRTMEYECGCMESWGTVGDALTLDSVMEYCNNHDPIYDSW